MTTTANEIHIDVVPHVVMPDLDGTVVQQLATLGRISMRRTSLLPNWITAISAIGILIATIAR